jgi:hypothetical protein
MSTKVEISTHKLSQGIDYTEILCPSPTQAIVNFSSMNPGKFERINWFSQGKLNKPTIQLFFKDENQHFYLGSHGDSVCETVVNKIMSTLDRHQINVTDVTTIGSSMGGYASLYYGFLLGVKNIVSVNPLVDLCCMNLHNNSLWTRKAAESNWINLNSHLLLRSGPYPNTFLVHGTYSADICSVEKLVESLRVIKATYTIKTINSPEHGWIGLSSEELICFLNNH